MELIRFINEDTQHKNSREEEEKRQQKLKAEKDEKLKGIEQQIQAIKSEIDKNKDGLSVLDKAREFILQIKRDQDPNWFEERKHVKTERLESLKNEWISGAAAWIEQRNRGSYQDTAFKYDEDIILDHDEEVHGQLRFELVDEW